MKPSEEARSIEDHFCAFRVWEAQQKENDRQVEKAYRHALLYGTGWSVAKHAGMCMLDVETEPLRVHDELIFGTGVAVGRMLQDLIQSEKRQKLLLLCSKKL